MDERERLKAELAAEQAKTAALMAKEGAVVGDDKSKDTKDSGIERKPVRERDGDRRRRRDGSRERRREEDRYGRSGWDDRRRGGSRERGGDRGGSRRRDRDAREKGAERDEFGRSRTFAEKDPE